MNILIYGAGVIGSVFAGKLSLSGQNVTVLARGKRLEEISRNGIVLTDPATGRTEIAKVNVISNLFPEDIYDYIFIVMQRTQVESVLPILKKNKSKNIVFVVNTSAGYKEWAQAVGCDRLMIAFPSAGGERVGGEVYYFIGKGFMRAFQTTTFGEYYGMKSKRLEVIIEIFKKAGIPTVFCKNMDAWQKTHVAMVTCIANALYKYDADNFALARSFEDIKLMVKGIKEGFSILNTLGIKVTPAKLNYFKLPSWILACIFKAVMGTRLAEITMAKHTAVAKSEMCYLQKEFDMLVQKSGEITPNINELKRILFNQG